MPGVLAVAVTEQREVPVLMLMSVSVQVALEKVTAPPLVLDWENVIVPVGA